MSARLSLLVDLASLLGREIDFDVLLGAACEKMATALGAERATLWLVDDRKNTLVARVARIPEMGSLTQPIDRGIAGYVARTGEIVRVDDASRDPRFDPSVDRATGFKTRSMLVAPIRHDAQAPVRGVVQLLNRTTETGAPGHFDADDERYVTALTVQLARALDLTTLRAADAGKPGVTLRGPFNRIVGTSAALTDVYTTIARAAGTDATVLLRGETGVGKGLFARAIHVNGKRQAGPFVTVDATTLPAQLVESELFGHERGAFTGADRRVPGRVEIAEGGTLFLDEIGDLPPDVQGKLLRFLQERSFERVGGRATIGANVRIVAATHRDLERAVAEGRFREDLYYRLRVVEITIPPLRERGADEIEALARHFADRYASRYERPAPVFEPETLRALRAHAWPGNVRELEHWIESAVVLSPDGVLRGGPRSATASKAPSTAAGSGAGGVRSAAGEAPASHVARGDAPEGDVPGGDAPTDEARRAGASGRGVTLPLGLSLEEASRRYLDATLAACDGNKTEAARRLGIGRNTVTRLAKDDRDRD